MDLAEKYGNKILGEKVYVAPDRDNSCPPPAIEFTYFVHWNETVRKVKSIFLSSSSFCILKHRRWLRYLVSGHHIKWQPVCEYMINSALKKHSVPPVECQPVHQLKRIEDRITIYMTYLTELSYIVSSLLECNFWNLSTDWSLCQTIPKILPSRILHCCSSNITLYCRSSIMLHRCEFWCTRAKCTVGVLMPDCTLFMCKYAYEIQLKLKMTSTHFPVVRMWTA